jgi:hypothetical protein
VSVWSVRDEPVLRYLVENPPQYNLLWTQSLAAEPHAGLPEVSEADFHRSVLTLRDADYVDWTSDSGEGGGGWHFTEFQVTGAGKQALGLWPGFDALGSPSELAGLLDALAHEAATEEERTNLNRAAGAVRGSAPQVVRSLFVGAVGAYTRARLGI